MYTLFPPVDGAAGPVSDPCAAAEPRPLLRAAPRRRFRLLDDDDEVRTEAPAQRTGLRRQQSRHTAALLSPRHHNAASQSRSDHEERRRIEEYRFTCRRLSEAAAWRGVAGDLWPLRILFWRILSGGRTVRMLTVY